MQVCAQCNGKKATIQLESIADLTGNTESFQTCGGAAGPVIVCTQCNGNGYQYS